MNERIRILQKMKNNSVFVVLPFIFFWCFFTTSAQYDEIIKYDFSEYSMEEMGIPKWGIGKREDRYTTSKQVVYEGFIFEALMKRFNPYANLPKTLLNLDEMSLHNGTLSFQNCYNGICSHFKKPDKLNL